MFFLIHTVLIILLAAPDIADIELIVYVTMCHIYVIKFIQKLMLVDKIGAIFIEESEAKTRHHRKFLFNH